jgi:hypothetical protein
MSYPFKVKFVIFDENKKVSITQQGVRRDLLWNNSLRDIIRKVFENDGNYKWLDRVEAAVSSIDEQKQLRVTVDSPHLDWAEYQHYIYFNQYQSHSNNYFTMEELKYISIRIKYGLEEYLGYEIDEPIIYIEAGDL